MNFQAGWTHDPHNLICACRLCGVKDPRHILMDKLKTEFFMLEVIKVRSRTLSSLVAEYFV
jgi:hypothetical protein